jgi:hypothetical protein
MRNTVLLGDLLGALLVATDEARHLDALDALQRVQMLLTERALARYADFHDDFPC